MEEHTIAAYFISQGALGVFLLLTLWVLWKKDRELTQAREKCAVEIKALNDAHLVSVQALRDKHADEIKVFNDKYVTKAETWANKYQELSDSTNKVIDSLERKFTRRGQ